MKHIYLTVIYCYVSICICTYAGRYVCQSSQRDSCRPAVVTSGMGGDDVRNLQEMGDFATGKRHKERIPIVL